MRKVLLVAAIFALLAGCAKEKSPVVAKVGREEITLAQLEKKLSKSEFGSEAEELNAKKTTLDGMIEEKLFLLEARERGLHEREDFAKQFEDAKKDAAIRQMYNDLIVEKVEATEEDVREMWERMGVEVKARVITTQTREEGEEILKELKAGADFAELAREKSVDRRSASMGGDLGWLTWDAYSDEFSAIIFALEPGEMSGVEEISGYYQIVKIEDRREVEDRDFEDEKEQLSERVTMRKRAAAAEEFLKGLKQDAAITFDDEVFSWLKEVVEERSPSGGGIPQFTPDEQKKIIVRFSGAEWSIEEVLSRFGPRFPPFADPESVKRGIESLVIGELLWREAQRRGIDKSESVEETVRARKESALARSLRSEISQTAGGVTDEEVQEYYDSHKEQYTNQELERAKTRIKMQLMQEKRREQEAGFIDGLKEKYPIEIFEENLLAKEESEED